MQRKDSKIPAIWCDLDGTLCNVGHRLHILDDLKDKPEQEKFDIFTDACDLDTPNKWCLDILWAMRLTGFEILYVTGRSEKFVNKTTLWLLDNVHFHDRYTPKLYMRPNGDDTPDDQMKAKIYRLDIKPYYDVAFCLEDRPSVARKLRSIGLKCLLIDDKEF